MLDFDLIDYQRKARNLNSPQKLFSLWDQVCAFYERGSISEYEWTEMKDVIWPSIRQMSGVRVMVDQSFSNQ
ncbi:MAG: hypothetical protein K8F91_19225 [Candidatus Obscuribacterales bacterium]|nr:hypothetical protein [Candidatus Obscuribacterales bacterium]